LNLTISSVEASFVICWLKNVFVIQLFL
jgi:hypothetical protein